MGENIFLVSITNSDSIFKSKMHKKYKRPSLVRFNIFFIMLFQNV